MELCNILFVYPLHKAKGIKYMQSTDNSSVNPFHWYLHVNELQECYTIITFAKETIKYELSKIKND